MDITVVGTSVYYGNDEGASSVYHTSLGGGTVNLTSGLPIIRLTPYPVVVNGVSCATYHEFAAAFLAAAEHTDHITYYDDTTSYDEETTYS